MNLSEEQEIKKEFQLERIILFSDAVFAILITIMVIDLKLPEIIRGASETDVSKAYNTLYLKLFAYILSFFFVSVLWIRHVKIFSFLKDFNKNILVLNLLFLFCISLFPFAITLITDVVNDTRIDTVQHTWGFNVYITVIFACDMAQSLLIAYLVRNKELLCVANDTIEHQLQWPVIKWNLLFIPLTLFIIFVVFRYFRLPFEYSIILAGLYSGIKGRILQKRYPEESQGLSFVKTFFTRSRGQKKSRKLH